MTLFRSILRTLQHAVGKPVQLHEFLASERESLLLSLQGDTGSDGSRIERWHEWFTARLSVNPYARGMSEPGVLLGWGPTKDGYTGTRRARRDLAMLTTTEVVPSWTCDIRHVEALTASKSDLHAYADLDAFAKACCSHLIRDLTPEGIAANLRHDQVRIVRNAERSLDHFARSLWDGRVVLSNAGGSHHFAAARYVAGQINKRVPLIGQLYVHALSPGSVASITRDFHIVAARVATSMAFNSLLDGLDALRAPVYVHALPSPHHRDGFALFFERSDPRATAAARTFLDLGFADLGQHLQWLAKRQSLIVANDRAPSPPLYVPPLPLHPPRATSPSGDASLETDSAPPECAPDVDSDGSSPGP